MSTFEYRKLLRASILLKVTYKTNTSPPIEGLAFTKNLGTIGLHMLSVDKIEKNTDMVLKIFLPGDKKPVTAEGKLIWQYRCSYVPDSKKQYYVCGVQFNDMSIDDAVKTSEFIRHLLKKESDEEVKKIIDLIEKEAK